MIRLYLAVLNLGQLRRELAQHVIPQIFQTPGVEVCWEDMGNTSAEPIFSNRNQITHRFLKKEPKQDFLLMIDDDVVPQQNPGELVHANKPIIGVATKVRNPGRAVNWNAYMKNPNQKGWSAIDFSRIDSSKDLLAVDAVGSGCILIKRCVLEHMVKVTDYGFNAPWTIEINEHGFNEIGTDIKFCDRAKAMGFQPYTTLQRWCEHFKTVGLLDITGYDDSDFRNPAPTKYKLHWGEWQIQQIDWEFIQGQLEKYKVKTILEFGAGLSSLLMSEKYKVTSYETNKDWKKEIESRINGHQLDVRLWNGRSGRGITSRYDLCFVDGPTGTTNGGPGREHSIRLASQRSDRVIVHDAGRTEEHRWQNKYLRPEFELVARNGNHQQRCQLWIRR